MSDSSNNSSSQPSAGVSSGVSSAALVGGWKFCAPLCREAADDFVQIRLTIPKRGPRNKRARRALQWAARALHNCAHLPDCRYRSWRNHPDSGWAKLENGLREKIWNLRKVLPPKIRNGTFRAIYAEITPGY